MYFDMTGISLYQIKDTQKEKRNTVIVGGAKTHMKKIMKDIKILAEEKNEKIFEEDGEVGVRD